MTLLCGCGEKHYNEWVEKNGNKHYYNEQRERIRNGFITFAGYTYVLIKVAKM
jgi:hypothetical protein